MKSRKAITLISLIITIVLLVIVAGTTIGVSLDRFKTNNLKKMYNDIELLNGKVENYFIKFGGLPILEKNYLDLNFTKNINDNENYYIIDLSAIENVTLNYGKEGYENPNVSDDVYIINEKSHTIYYVRGIELSEGKIYHSLKLNKVQNVNVVGPTKSEINILSGTLSGKNEEGIEKYIENVEIEIIPGKDSTNGIKNVEYSIEKVDLTTNESTTETAEISERTVINNLESNKKYILSVTVTSNNNLKSENTYTIIIPKIIEFKIDDVSYRAEENMNWKDFCNSIYNNDNAFSIDSNENEVVINGRTITKNSTTEKDTDIIEEGAMYYKGANVPT